MSTILGLNFGHDGSVCLVKNGKLEFAITTERLTKIKKQQGFTDEVIRHVLESTNTKLEDIGVGQLVYENSILYKKSKMGVYNAKIQIINCGNKFEIIINSESKIDELLNFDYLVIDDSPITVNIKSLNVDNQIKEDYKNKINIKYPKVKVVL